MDRRAILRDLFDAAVAAANPAICVPPALPDPPPAPGRLIVLAAGKAGASMAAAALAHYRRAAPLTLPRLSGIVVTRRGYGMPVDPLPLVEAGHPVPDTAGIVATQFRSTPIMRNGLIHVALHRKRRTEIRQRRDVVRHALQRSPIMTDGRVQVSFGLQGNGQIVVDGRVVR